MKSTITRMYDYKMAAIPDALRLWRVTDAEMQAHLETLSRNHAFETDVSSVHMGDSVACRAESAVERWNRPVMLFYPGRGICDAAVENACVGAALGEARTVVMDGAEVKLTVQRIVRRQNMPIGDELAKAEGVAGVETLDGYIDWYRQNHEPTRKLHAGYKMALSVLKEVTERSEYFLDEEEKCAWVTDRVNVLYDAMVAAGMDPKIPKEGFDFLTEEQAKAQMYAQNQHFFTEYVAQCFMYTYLTGRDLEDFVRERLPELAASANMTPEMVIAQSGKTMIYSKFASDASMEALSEYTKQFLEE